MRHVNIISYIDVRINGGEYDNNQPIKNKLTKIRGKILHKTPLTKSDVKLLTSEGFIF
jgi:hypothetical protein